MILLMQRIACLTPSLSSFSCSRSCCCKCS